MLLLKRRYHFSAAHRLHSPYLSDAENQEIYGSCNRSNSHGHNYQFDVWLEGTPNAETQMMLDIVTLDAMVQQYVLDVMDHYHLDYDVPLFKDLPTTAENIAKVIFHTLQQQPLAGTTIHRVQVFETDNNRAVYPA